MMRLPKAKHKHTNLFPPCLACRSKVHVLAKECNFCGFIVGRKKRRLSESATRDRVSRQWKEARKSRPIPSACVAREDVSSERQTAQQHSPGLMWYENTSVSTDSTRRGQIQGMHSEEQQVHQKQTTSADQQEQDAEEEFFLGLISSPDRIRRITKQLRKLQFCNPGPQMRSHATDSRLRDRPPQYLLTASSQSSEGSHQAPKRLDLCDCMNSECPGCFLPCPKCRSNKCGTVCRVGRSWVYCREVQRDRASDSDMW